MDKRIEMKFLFFFLFLTTVRTTEANKEIIYENVKPDIDILLLNYRVSNLVYNEEDIKTIENHANDLLSVNDEKSLQSLKDYSYTFKNVIESVQLEREQILLLRRYAISIQNHKLIISNKSKKYLDDIIWWSEVRIIKNKQSLIKFLNSQMTISRRKDALRMFAEEGMVTEIEYWSSQLKFKKSKLLFELAVRKAKIRNELRAQKINTSEILITELNKSINDIIPMSNKKIYALQYFHFFWLLKQFGIYRETESVKEILNNLTKDEIFYIKDDIDQLSLEQKEIMERGINEVRPTIRVATRKALNPYEILKYPNRIY